MPALIWSHSVFFMAKLQRSTAAEKPGSMLKGLMAVMIAEGSAYCCALNVAGIWVFQRYISRDTRTVESFTTLADVVLGAGGAGVVEGAGAARSLVFFLQDASAIAATAKGRKKLRCFCIIVRWFLRLHPWQISCVFMSRKLV
jgi:hypothetical protein